MPFFDLRNNEWGRESGPGALFDMLRPFLTLLRPSSFEKYAKLYFLFFLTPRTPEEPSRRLPSRALGRAPTEGLRARAPERSRAAVGRHRVLEVPAAGRVSVRLPAPRPSLEDILWATSLGVLPGCQNFEMSFFGLRINESGR